MPTEAGEHRPIMSVGEQIRAAEALGPLTPVEEKWTETIASHYRKYDGKNGPLSDDYIHQIAHNEVVMSRVGKGVNVWRQGASMQFAYEPYVSTYLNTPEENARYAPKLPRPMVVEEIAPMVAEPVRLPFPDLTPIAA